MVFPKEILECFLASEESKGQNPLERPQDPLAPLLDEEFFAHWQWLTNCYKDQLCLSSSH